MLTPPSDLKGTGTRGRKKPSFEESASETIPSTWSDFAGE
jgi:hypothetical protein